MMVNETAARNIAGGQLWQRTVPTQMPWMSGYVPSSPTSIIQFGQSPVGSPDSSVGSPPRISQHTQLTPEASPTAPTLYQMPSPTIINNNNNEHLSFINTCNRAHFNTATTQTSPITTNSSTFMFHHNTIPGSNLSQYDQPLLTVQSNISPVITQMTNSQRTIAQQHATILDQCTNINFPLTGAPLDNIGPVQGQQRINNLQLPQADQPVTHPILTFMPQKKNDSLINQSLPQTKRSSIEVDEDGSANSQAPPTKQWLSESMMLRQFGSLNLSNNLRHIKHDSPNYDADAEIEEDEDDIDRPYKKKTFKNYDSEELERYVYLIFKDKKQSDLRQFTQGPNQSTLNRLARDEMDKINKAVVLWNPSMHGRPCNTTPEVEELTDDEPASSVIGKNCTIAADDIGIISEVIEEDDETMFTAPNDVDETQSKAIYGQIEEDLMVD